MDGFPVTRDQWTAMIEHEVLPDTVVVLDDEDTPTDYLLTRFTEQRKLPHPSTFKQTADKESEGSQEKVCRGRERGKVGGKEGGREEGKKGRREEARTTPLADLGEGGTGGMCSPLSVSQ